MKLVVGILTQLGVIVAVTCLSEADIELVKEATEQIMAEQPNNGHRRSSDPASESLLHANTPTKRTKALLDGQMRRELETRAIALLMRGNGNSKNALRSLNNPEIDLFARAKQHELCTATPINCLDPVNRIVSPTDNKEYRTYDGVCNNVNNYHWGMEGSQHLRENNAYYYDNDEWAVRTLTANSTKKAQFVLPSPRKISEAVHKVTGSRADSTTFTLVLFQWGQFLDHDIISTPVGRVSGNTNCCNNDNKAFCLVHRAEEGDSFFPKGHCFETRRSFTVLTCDKKSKLENQINELTSYIDAGNVYGVGKEQTDSLRTFINGFMKTSTSDFLPVAPDPSEVACLSDPSLKDDPHADCLLAGDSRVNEQPGLASFHTVFVRYHNKIARKLALLNPAWNDEKIFLETRKIVGALMQKITYSEFLPALLGQAQLDTHGVSANYNYNENLDASVIQSFSLAFRFHNMIPSTIHLAHMTNGGVANTDSEALDDHFMDPSLLYKHGYLGLDHAVLGLSLNACPHATRLMADAARNKLFKDATTGLGVDLAALNILRGRDWGTSPYVFFRTEVCGFEEVTTFDQLTDHSAENIAALRSVYASPLDIDLWTGLVTETPISGTMAGPTQACLVAKQFANLKFGDRFWFERANTTVAFTGAQLQQINNMTLARVFCDTLDVNGIRSNVFLSSSSYVPCSSVPDLDINYWSSN